MSTILERIVVDKRAEVAARKRAASRATLEARCAGLPAPRDFEAALRPPGANVALIAEVKKASPSRGVLAADIDPVALAETYGRHGAHAISVLTDEKYFQGHLDLLAAIRDRVTVPLLRKDFTIEEWQLWESRAAGADAVLLIVSILEDPLLRDLAAAAKGLGLTALVECHTAAEVDRACPARARDDPGSAPARPARPPRRQRERLLHRRPGPPRRRRGRPCRPRGRGAGARRRRSGENRGTDAGGRRESASRGDLS